VHACIHWKMVQKGTKGTYLWLKYLYTWWDAGPKSGTENRRDKSADPPITSLSVRSILQSDPFAALQPSEESVSKFLNVLV
jgi:hypothetical protein